MAYLSQINVTTTTNTLVEQYYNRVSCMVKLIHSSMMRVLENTFVTFSTAYALRRLYKTFLMLVLPWDVRFSYMFWVYEHVNPCILNVTFYPQRLCSIYI